MSDQEKIAICYRQMYDGMVQKDRGLLSDVLDGSFVLIHMTGMRQGREAFIRAVEDGTLNYYAATHERINADIHGDTAELIGQSLVRAAVFGGGEHSWRLRLRCRLTRQNDTWKITEAKASTY